MHRIRETWRLLNAPCRVLSRLASDSLDRRLGRFERLALRAHLLSCGPCRRYFRQIRLLGPALRRFGAEVEPRDDATGPGPALPDEVRDRIKRRLAEG